LLSSAERAQHLSELWAGVLLERLTPDEPQSRTLRDLFRGWLEEQLATDRAWNDLAATLVASEGEVARDPALIYLLDRGPTGAADVAGAVARQFLGLQLECARCHDHPFGDATQADYHGLSAYFARMRVRQDGGRGRFTVREAPLGEHRWTFVDGGRREVAPAPFSLEPGEGGGQVGRLPKGLVATKGSRRVAFARWLVAPENPWFARAVVNRTWAQLLGRGLVEPVDDLFAAEDSPHAALLDELAAAFRADGHSLRRLQRAILRSRTYQRAAAGEAEALAAARPLFGASRVRPLGPRVLATALLQVAGRDRRKPGELASMHTALVERVRGLLAASVPNGAGDPDAVTTLEGVTFVGGRELGALAAAVARRTVDGDPAATSRLRRLFLLTLSRPPRPAERAPLLKHLEQRGGDRPAYEELAWALLASSEFTTNH
jgi:hypothetical protein